MERSELREAWQSRMSDYCTRAVSTREWCEAHGVTIWQLQYWRKRLSVPSDGSSLTGSAVWRPVRVVPEQSAGESQGIAIHLGPARIVVSPGFDQPTLAQALRVVASSILNDGPSC